MSTNRMVRGTASARFIPNPLQRDEMSKYSNRSNTSVWRAYRGDPVSTLVFLAISDAAKALGYPPPPVPTSISSQPKFEARG